MRVFFRIGKGVVHTVHQCICAGAEVRRTLHDERENEPETFPSFTHGKRAMGSITMLKKCLGKERQIPMRYKENEYSHYFN
jgi:hypothetical protein